MDPISQATLVCVCVPVLIDDEGNRWTNELWARDLALHLDYLSNLTLCCQGLRRNPSASDVSLNQPPFHGVQFVDLPASLSYGAAIVNTPRWLAKLWRAVRRTEILHTGFAGWPVCDGWLAVPLAKMLGKFVVTNVESTSWRTSDPGAAWSIRIRGFVMERLTRFCVRIADLRLFTSGSYAREFLPPGAPRCHVVPATWIDEQWILGEEQADAAWEAKQGTVRLLFAGRLIPDKGVGVLLEAMGQAAAARAELDVTIMGAGPLRDTLAGLAQECQGPVGVRFLDPIPYGNPFLEFVSGQDAVLVPSLSDEQPRIIFDAASQALPVIGSATGGISEIVEAEVTGRLLPASNATALAETLIWASKNRLLLRAMGMAALKKCRQFTHKGMHLRRHEILRRALSEGASKAEP